jgi:hypothetical protein
MPLLLTLAAAGIAYLIREQRRLRADVAWLRERVGRLGLEAYEDRTVTSGLVEQVNDLEQEVTAIGCVVFEDDDETAPAAEVN